MMAEAEGEMQGDPRRAGREVERPRDQGPRSPDPGIEIEVDVSDTQDHLAVDPVALAGLVRRALARRGIARASISVALVDDRAILEVNRRHLGHDWPTDVISFLLSDPGEGELVGELVVSAQMAAATAAEAGVDPSAELALYLVHGTLHLCGLDDRSPEDAAEMRRREAEILSAEGLTNTYPLVGPAEAGREETRWGG